MRSHDAIFHHISHPIFKIRFAFDWNHTVWPSESKVESKVWKSIENLMCVRISIYSQVRIMTSHWLFPIYQKYWIILINQKWIVKIASCDNLNNWLQSTYPSRLKMWWKLHRVWPHFNTILSTHHVSAKHM